MPNGLETQVEAPRAPSRLGGLTRRQTFLLETVPLFLVLVILTWLLCADGLEIALQATFYTQGEWYGRQAPWSFLYDYGHIPGLALGGGALLVLLGSLVRLAPADYRKPALYVVLLLLIGPGILVNLILKDYWGRPRPAAIHQFNGSQTYRPVWSIAPPGNYSFPSGHATIGFFLMTPFFFLRQRHRRAATAFLVTGLAYGLLLGLVRFMQGGHFISDVLWAGGLLYLLGIGLGYLFRFDQPSS